MCKPKTYYKSYKIRLEPNNKQKTQFNQHAGVARHAYNIGLAYCNQKFKEGEKVPSAIDLHKWLVSTVKKENPWYYNSSKSSPQEALRHLEKAFKNFHRIQKASNYKELNFKYVDGVKVSSGLKGLPKFKKKSSKDSFYLDSTDIKINRDKIKLPKIGVVKMSESVDVKSIKNCTISRVANNWFIAFKVEFTPNRGGKRYDTIGVDLGITNLATLSDGTVIDNKKPLKLYLSRLKTLNQSLNRKFRLGEGYQSKNYFKTKLKIDKIYKKISNIRKDNIHKVTTMITKNYNTVVIEDLDVKDIAKNKLISQSIMDVSPYEFRRQLMYKMSWYGGELIIANRFYPSSKLCSSCGSKAKNLQMSDRVYKCEDCSIELDRDLNASINLNKLAVRPTVSAFGGNSTHEDGVEFTCELGIKHKKFIFL